MSIHSETSELLLHAYVCVTLNIVLIVHLPAVCSSRRPGQPAGGEAGQAQCGALHLLQEDRCVLHTLAQPGATHARRHRLLD